MSHIKNIEIKNFKSIRHVKIEDCRRVNVFIGYPNVGKSNILEAMSLMSYLQRQYKVPFKNNFRYKELIDLFSDGDRDKDAEVFVDDYVFSLRFINKSRLDFSVIEKLSYVERTNSSKSFIFKTDNINKDGIVQEQTFSNSIPFDENKFVVRKYQFREEYINGYAPNENPKELSSPYGRNLSEVIRYNADLRKECGELFSTYNLKLIFDENNSIIVQKQLDEFSAFQFSLQQVADTLQRLIFHKAAILTSQNKVLLFEEPEAHMFPPYIGKFTADVMFDKNNNQYFMATHSPFVLNDFMEDMDNSELSIYAVGYVKGETTIVRLTDKQVSDIYQYGVDLFFNLEDFLKDVVA
jgi:AAA15 family ATPase/GTPase